MTLLTTPPLPPKIIHILNKLNINSVNDLRNKGVITTFLLVKSLQSGITEHLLWQFIILVENRSTKLTEIEKKYWRCQLKQHPHVDFFPPMAEMQQWMHLAIDQAKYALDENEVPVGAIVVYKQKVIGSGFNQCIGHHNISHHAEIQALAMAGQTQHNYRLDQCDVYVSLEPCAMCASALIQARVRRVIYGAAERKTGAAGSVLNLFTQRTLNTHTAVLGGILAKESQFLLQCFFQSKRH